MSKINKEIPMLTPSKEDLYGCVSEPISSEIYDDDDDVYLNK
jgi:hypothetical protein